MLVKNNSSNWISFSVKRIEILFLINFFWFLSSLYPFISIDEGVEDLIEIAVEEGKKQNKKIKLGICGEHGGDPKSIHFCSKAGLNYVSCSPYRVPIARLAAAQAELKKNNRI